MLLRLIVVIALMTSLLSSSGCNQKGSTPAAPSPPSSFNVSGSVLETTPSGSRPLDGVTLFVKVLSGRSVGHFGSTTTDPQGRYSVSNLPPGTVYIEATWYSYVQPCFASIDLQKGDALLDVEVVSAATLLSLGPSSLRTIKPRTVSGLVFETTPSGSRPVAGAKLQVWADDWLYGASTSTDASGRYLLCNVPQAFTLSVYTDKEGYHQQSSDVLPGGDTTVDIQLERP